MTAVMERHRISITTAIVIRLSYVCCRHCAGHGLYIDWNRHRIPCRAYWTCVEGSRAVVQVGVA